MTDTHDAWEAILNPDVLRTKLISAGLFLVAHEMLLDSLQRNLRFFYSDGWTVEKGWITSDQYEAEVLALDPTGRKNRVRGSIAWFRKMDAISDDDEVNIKTVTDARNSLAHEMTNMISGSKPPEFTGYFQTLVSLVAKIDRWWIINIEMTTNPDFDGQDVDEADVVPGSTLMMDLLSFVALGEGEEAWALHREFQERWADRKFRT